MNQYPEAPGWKERDTAEQAAFDFTGPAETIRDQAYELLCLNAHTADEVAHKLGKTLLAVRPRISELAKQGKIEDSGQRRVNDSGKMAIVWRAFAPF